MPHPLARASAKFSVKYAVTEGYVLCYPKSSDVVGDSVLRQDVSQTSKNGFGLEDLVLVSMVLRPLFILILSTYDDVQVQLAPCHFQFRI